MPDIKFPEKSGEYKFILAELEGVTYFRFGRSSVYHDTILEEFKEETESEEVVTHGGGRFFIDTEKKTLRFFGESKAFGKFDEEKLKNLDFGEWEIKIE